MLIAKVESSFQLVTLDFQPKTGRGKGWLPMI